MSIAHLPTGPGMTRGCAGVRGQHRPTIDAAVAGLHQSLDVLTQVQAGDLADRADLAQVLQELERAHRRLTAAKLTVITAAEAARVARHDGHTSTGSWVAHNTARDRASAAREAALAHALSPQAPTTGNVLPGSAGDCSTDTAAASSGAPADVLTATRAALAEGAIGAENAAIIVHTLGSVPADTTPHERLRMEKWLLVAAKHRSPARLRPLARRVLAAASRPPAEVGAHAHALLTAEEDAAYARARLTMHDHPDGTTSGHFVVPTLAAHALRKVLQAMTAPRRTGRATAARDGSSTTSTRVGGVPGEHRRQTGDPGQAGFRPWAEQHGEAFTQLLEHLPTDHLSPRTAATVLITMPLKDLRDGLCTADVDTGVEATAQSVRRLACTSGLIPAVLGGDGIPVDIGRTRRLFTEPQRAALATVYDSCAAELCDRPYAWCELHHEQPWSRGGPTDLANALPLCGHHHRLIHHPGYEHEVHTGDGVAGRRSRRRVSFRERGLTPADGAAISGTALGGPSLSPELGATG